MLQGIWGSQGERGLKEGLKEDCFIGQRKVVREKVEAEKEWEANKE